MPVDRAKLIYYVVRDLAQFAHARRERSSRKGYHVLLGSGNHIVVIMIMQFLKAFRPLLLFCFHDINKVASSRN